MAVTPRKNKRTLGPGREADDDDREKTIKRISEIATSGRPTAAAANDDAAVQDLGGGKS